MTAKQAPTPAVAITTPPIAGPITREPLKRLAFRATAFGSSSRPTNWNVRACRLGASKTAAVPPSRARTYTIQSSVCPLSTRTARRAEIAIDAACMTIIVLRLSKRSARTPAGSEKTVNGAKRRNASRPTATGECVSRTTTQASAMFCIQVPLSEITWPAKYSR